jgi:hypothetical protein
MLPDPYPKGLALKYYYLRILEQADKTARFEFLDLPPELRLMVYRKLLLFMTPHEQIPSGRAGRVYPQILQTCKLIQEEANGILYDENTFVADARSRTESTSTERLTMSRFTMLTAVIFTTSSNSCVFRKPSMTTLAFSAASRAYTSD